MNNFIRVILVVAAVGIGSFLIFSAVFSQSLSRYVSDMQRFKSSIESAGVSTLVYNMLVPALVEDATSQQSIQIPIADSDVEINLDTPTKRQALVKIVNSTLDKDDNFENLLFQSVQQVLKIIRGADEIEPLPVMEKIVNELANSVEANISDLSIGNDIAGYIVESQDLSALDTIGISLSKETSQEVFGEFIDDAIVDVLREYADYVSGEEDEFYYKLDTDELGDAIKKLLFDEIDNAAAKNQLKLGPTLGPVIQSQFEDLAGVEISEFPSERIDEAIEDAGLQEWRTQIVKDVVGGFIDYTLGKENAQTLTVNFGENRPVLIDVISDISKEQTTTILNQLPDCVAGSTSEQSAVQRLDNAKLPSCIPTLNALLSSNLASSVLPQANIIGGILTAFLPSQAINVRGILIQGVETQLQQAINDFVPETITYEWATLTSQITQSDISDTDVPALPTLEITQDALDDIPALAIPTEGIELEEEVPFSIVNILTFNWVALAILGFLSVLGFSKLLGNIFKWFGIITSLASFVALGLFVYVRFYYPGVIASELANLPFIEEENFTKTGNVLRSVELNNVITNIISDFTSTAFIYTSLLLLGGLLLVFTAMLITRRNSEVHNTQY